MSDRRRSGRVRHQVERFGFETPSDNAAEPKTNQSYGAPLGDIKAVEEKLKDCNPDDEVIKNIHLLLYNKFGSKNARKDSIRKFDGFQDDQPTSSRIEKLNQNKKISLEMLQNICTFFDLKTSDSKEEIAKEIIEFITENTAPVATNESTVEETAKTETQSGTPEKKRKRLTTDNPEEQKTAEKKPRHTTPFTKYTRSMYSEVKKEHPKWQKKKVTQYIKRKWNELPEEEKKQYELEDAKENDKSKQQSDQGNDSDEQSDDEPKNTENNATSPSVEQNGKKGTKDQSENDKHDSGQSSKANKNKTDPMVEDEANKKATEEYKSHQSEKVEGESVKMDVQGEKNENKDKKASSANAEHDQKSVHVQQPKKESADHKS